MEKSTIQKIILWSAVLVLIALLVYGGYKASEWAANAGNNINFNSGLANVDLPSIFNGSGTPNVTVALTITNANYFSIPVSGLFLQMFYNNQLVVYTSDPQPSGDTDSFVIPPIAADGTVGVVNVNHNITINLGNATPLLTNYLSKTPSQLTFSVKVKLWGFIPFTYTGTENVLA